MRNLSGLMLITIVYLIVIPSLAFAQSPGDTVGWTYQSAYSFFQTQGSTGRRIAVDDAGNVSFTWTKSLGAFIRVNYNYRDSYGFSWPGNGTTISFRNADFDSQIDVMRDGREAIAYHYFTSDLYPETLYCGIDAYRGLGAFDFRRPTLNRPLAERFDWPSLTVDLNDRIHIVGVRIVPYIYRWPLSYTRSDSTGNSWIAPLPVDTVNTFSPIVVSSPVSNKVAIVYCHSTDSSSYKEDIYYVESLDGTTWDFENGKINLTQYGVGGDSLFAFTDLDAAYDYNNCLNIVWNARRITERGPSDRVFLFHINTEENVIHEITHIDMPDTDNCHFVPEGYRYTFGGWNLAINKMSMAADSANNILHMVYCRYDTSDCSQDSIANGEIYYQQSQDGGHSWSAPTNLTNSRTPGCSGANCASDICPSMAKRVNDYIHIFYECFRPANVQNSMLYMRLPAEPQVVGDTEKLPNNFLLSQNYPNPFNARTTIKYSLKEKSEITISIYNIVGEKVTTLFRETQPAGEHQAVWDASRFSSGIYFAKLESDGKSESIRMVLLK